MLNLIEHKRYQRQIQLPTIGIRGQTRLKKAKVLCIGLGGLGTPLTTYLVSSGIGNLGIIDDDSVTLSNLPRQILYTAEDCGQTKVAVAFKKLHTLNPHCKVTTHPGKLNLYNVLTLFNQYDIIADCTDNFATRYLINDACVHLNKPLISASVHHFQGHVFGMQPGGACYRCLFPDWAANSVLNCTDAGILATVPAILATIQTNELIKLILKSSPVLSNRLLIFDSLNNVMNTIELSKDPHCHCCSKSISFLELTRPIMPTSDIEHLACDVTELEKLLSKQSIQLLDVRTEKEFHEEHLTGAINIPLATFPKSQSTHHNTDSNIQKNYLTTLSKQKQIVVYCQSGIRSQKACRLLLEYGFESVLWLRN